MARSDASEHWFDPSTGAVILNDTAIADSSIMSALTEQHPEVASLVQWSNGLKKNSRNASLFERDRFVTPERIYDQMRTAYDAAHHDDVVSGVLETTEALAFSKCDFECEDEDEEDVWNQIADDLNLDARLREMWRELFIVSQFYMVVWWGTKTYKVRGKSETGVKRKRTFAKLKVPTALGLLDPLKVVPIGNMMFNKERLAYIASRGEADAFDEVLAGKNTADLTVIELIERKYEPDQAEKSHLSDLGIDPTNLYLLNEDRVWRHTDTRPQYERFSAVRLKSVFEILDLKQQLRQMDRAYLIGGTNFIILVKKGSDEHPARPAEIAALANQVRVAARVPVIVGDHRLEVEIVTPKTDLTLKPERYNTLDARIEARLFGMFMTGNYAAGAKGDDSIKLAKVVAKGLESRRLMIRRAFEKRVIKQCFDKNPELQSSPPKLRFHPKHIALDFDPAWASLIQDLRDRGDLSRASILDELDYDQDEEFRKRKIEAEKYDKVFQTAVPFNSPQNQPGGAPGGAPGGPPGQGGPPKPPAPPMGPPQATKPTTPKGAGRKGGGNNNGGGMNRESIRPNKPK